MTKISQCYRAMRLIISCTLAIILLPTLSTFQDISYCPHYSDIELSIMSRRTNYHYDGNDADDDDDESVTRLHDKVKLLKTVSIQIGEETREHNRHLKSLDSGIDSLTGSTLFNIAYVKKLARGGHNRIVFYLLAFAFFVLIVIYFINRRL